MGHPTVRRYRYYEILEISRNATQEEIKQAYRRLAKIYHPDANPPEKKAEVEIKFKKLNEAYGVLYKPTERANYDNSPTECPICWTHEVLQITGTQFRCRHCGCRFDSSRVSEVIEQVEKAAIPARLRKAVNVFQTTQCSWCRRYYTQPFLCPYGRLQSSCSPCVFEKIGDEERQSLLNDEKWWWRMADMLQQVQERGVMAKCRECFALNPNPQEAICWQCGKDSLRCPNPKCEANPFLGYDIKNDIWKCPSAGCSKKFKYIPKKRVVEQTASKEICPKCGSNLYYDAELLLWRCKKDKRIYTYQELVRFKRETQRSTAQGQAKVSIKKSANNSVLRELRSAFLETWEIFKGKKS